MPHVDVTQVHFIYKSDTLSMKQQNHYIITTILTIVRIIQLVSYSVIYANYLFEKSVVE